MCLAEFSIQGPSDGHRRAQGLKFSEEKGLEYTDASGKCQISTDNATGKYKNGETIYPCLSLEKLSFGIV